LRSCEIEVSRQSASARLNGALDAIHVLDQPHALDRQCALIDQRVEQRARQRQQRSDLSLSMPTTPIAPRPVRIGRNNRLAPGSVSAPRPAAGCCARPSSRPQVAASSLSSADIRFSPRWSRLPATAARPHLQISAV